MIKSLLKNSNSNIIVGVGSALVDILLRESDEFLAKTWAQRGGMTLVDAEKIDSILSQSKEKPYFVPGGSACNTIIGIGKLGGNSRFIGKRGKDNLGENFENALKSHNVEPLLSKSETPTGRVLSIITPDAQRSMFTFLGAASEIKPSEFTPEKFRDVLLAHLEGYLLFNPQLMLSILKAVKEAGSLISLDLASFTVVEDSKEIITDIVKEYVDIVLANEDEARVYTGFSDETKALQMLAKDVKIAVIKLGKRGSIISSEGKIFKTGILGSGEALDTTGAGDLWASGFLFGLTRGFNMEKCGELGAACGYEVCQVIGAHIPEKGWSRIKNLV